MSDNDPIRRGDAIREIDCGGCYGSCANPSSCQLDDVEAIRALPAVTVGYATDEIKKRVFGAIFDPGKTEGYKGARSLTEWQTDAVMRVLSSLEPQSAPTLAAPTLAEALAMPEVRALVEALERIAVEDEGDPDLNEWGPAAVAQAALAALKGGA